MHETRNMPAIISLAILAISLLGCEDPADSGGNTGAGGGVLFDGGAEAFIWDASNDGGGSSRDMAILRDAAPARTWVAGQQRN